MSKTTNWPRRPTKPFVPRNPEKHAAWLKEPIAIIERPLRAIKDKTTQVVYNEKGQREERISPIYLMARDFADAGDGAAVKRISALVLANA